MWEFMRQMFFCRTDVCSDTRPRPGVLPSHDFLTGGFKQGCVEWFRKTISELFVSGDWFHLDAVGSVVEFGPEPMVFDPDVFRSRCHARGVFRSEFLCGLIVFPNGSN